MSACWNASSTKFCSWLNWKKIVCFIICCYLCTGTTEYFLARIWKSLNKRTYNSSKLEKYWPYLIRNLRNAHPVEYLLAERLSTFLSSGLCAYLNLCLFVLSILVFCVCLCVYLLMFMLDLIDYYSNSAVSHFLHLLHQKQFLPRTSHHTI